MEKPMLFKIVPAFIGFVFVLIICIFVGYGLIAYKVLSDPNGVAKTVGSTIGEVVKSAKDQMDQHDGR